MIRTVLELKEQKKLITNCFVRSGLLSGFSQVHSHFNTEIFAAGEALRDANLPRIDMVYIKDVLSLHNLSATPVEGVIIPESRISQRLQALRQYYNEGNGFRKFYFSLGATAVTSTELKNNNVGTEPDGKQKVRNLFKLGSAENMPRGAPGRVPTAYGTLLSTREQYLSAVTAEKHALDSKARKVAKQVSRNNSEHAERPIVDYFVKIGILARGKKLLRETLVQFLICNPSLGLKYKVSKYSVRSELVDIVLSFLKEKSMQK